MDTGDFIGRMAKLINPPPPPTTVVLELTYDEALIVKEACYFYWSQGKGRATVVQRPLNDHWHNPTQLSDKEAGQVAQDVYAHYMSNIHN